MKQSIDFFAMEGKTIIPKQRDERIDQLKYILIILVVIGHFIEPSRYSDQLSCWLYSFIYSFHMPLFIWVSGFFYKHRPLNEEIKKCIPLFEVCLISHVTFAYLWNDNLTIGRLVGFGYTPSWYLFSLIIWRLMSCFLIDRCDIKKIFLISVILEVLIFFVIPKHGGAFSIVRTFSFYPFFIIGYLMKDNQVFVLNNYKKSIISFGVVSLVCIFITSGRLQHQCFFQRAGLLELARNSDYGLAQLFLFRYFVLICSTLISALVLLITYNLFVIRKFAYFGQGTLFIYYGQTLLYPFAVKSCSTLGISLITSAVAIFFLTYLSRTSFSKWLMNPITSYFSYMRLKE